MSGLIVIGITVGIILIFFASKASKQKNARLLSIELQISKCKEDYNDYFTINLPKNHNDLSFLSKINNTKELTLSNINQINDYTPLKYLKNIENIFLEYVGEGPNNKVFGEICNQLKSLPKLKNLTLNGLNKVTSIDPIVELKELNSLTLHTLNCENYNNLNLLENIEELTLITNNIKDINFLNSLKKLKELEIRPFILDNLYFFDSIRDYSYSSYFTLKIMHNPKIKIGDTWKIRGIKKLSLLYANSNKQIELENLVLFKGLKELDLITHINSTLLNYLSNIEIGTLTDLNLNVLHLDDKQIGDIENLNLKPLNNIKSLQKVRIGKWLSYKSDNLKPSVNDIYNFDIYSFYNNIYYSRKSFESNLDLTNNKFNINIFNYKSLHYLSDYPEINKIHFETPSLKSFEFINSNKKIEEIRFSDFGENYSNQISSITNDIKKMTINTKNFPFDLKNILQFKNLEELIIFQIDDNIFNLDLLSNFKKLKKIYLRGTYKYEAYDFKNLNEELVEVTLDLSNSESNLRELTHIEKLKIYHDKYPKIDENSRQILDRNNFDFNNLLNLTKLKELIIRDVYLFNNDISLLNKLPNLNKLEIMTDYDVENFNYPNNFDSLTNIKNFITDSYARFNDESTVPINVEEITFKYDIPNNKFIEKLLKLQKLKKIKFLEDYWYDFIGYTDDDGNYFEPERYDYFSKLINKGIIVECGGEEFKKIELLDGLKNDEINWYLINQLKNHNIETATELGINVEGYDEYENDFSIENLSLLEKYKNLEKLSLNGHEYADEHIEVQLPFLNKFISLKSLSFSNCDFQINDIVESKKLEKISLYYSKPIINDSSNLNFLIPSLKVFESHNYLVWNEIKRFIHCFPNLEELKIDDATYDVYEDEAEEYYVDYQDILKFPKLKKLSCDTFSSTFGEYSKSMVELSELKELEEINWLSLDYDTELTKFKSLKKIDTLVVREVNSITLLMDIMKNIEVKSINLWQVNDDPNNYKLFSNIKDTTTRFYISSGNINEVSDFSFLSGLNNLEEIDIGSNVDGYWSEPVDISSLNNLKKLNTIKIPIYYDEDTMDNKFALSGFSSLKKLEINNMFYDLDNLKELPMLESLEITHPKNLNFSENSMPNLKKLKFYAHNLESIENIKYLKNLENLEISSCSKIERFSSIFNLNKLKFLKLSGCDLLKEINFVRNLKLNSLRLWGETSNQDLNFEILDNSRFTISNLDISIKNVSIDLENFPDLIELNTLALGDFKSIKNLGQLNKFDKLQTLKLSNLNFDINLEDFSQIPKLKEIDIYACEKILNKNYFDNNEKINVKMTEKYDPFNKNKIRKPYTESHIYDTGIEWVHSQIRNKGADSIMGLEWLFEFFKDTKRFNIFSKLYKIIAEEISKAETTDEQFKLILKYQYISLSNNQTVHTLNNNYSEIEKNFLIDQYFSNFKEIFNEEMLIVSNSFLMAYEVLSDLYMLLNFYTAKGFGAKNAFRIELYKFTQEQQNFLNIIKFEKSLFYKNNNEFLNLQKNRFYNSDFESLIPILNSYSEKMSKYDDLDSIDWSNNDLFLDKIPDNITPLGVYFSQWFKTEACKSWIKKNTWIFDNYSRMITVKDILTKLSREGYNIDDYFTYDELDKQLSKTEDKLFEDKKQKTEENTENLEEIYDTEDFWERIPQFTIDINLKKQNPFFELYDCSALQDISGLKQLKHLKDIQLHSCFILEDLSPLEDLPDIERLELIDCYKLKDISVLGKLEKLNSLNIREAKELEDLTPLLNLKNLTKIFLYGCDNIKDLSSLKNNKKLEILTVPNCKNKAMDLSTFYNFENLYEISLVNCYDDIDLEFLSNFKNLKHLLLMASPSLTKIPKLDFSNYIDTLTIGQNALNNLSNLKNLVELKTLRFNNYVRNIQNLNDLNNLINLEYLDVAHFTHLNNLDSLKNFKKLKWISIESCLSLESDEVDKLKNLKNNPKIIEPIFSVKKPSFLNDKDLNNANYKDLGSLILSSGQLLIRDFDHKGYWGNFSQPQRTNPRSIINFDKDTKIDVQVEYSKENSILSSLITINDNYSNKNAEWIFGGTLVCDGDNNATIIVQDENSYIKTEDDEKHKKYIDNLTNNNFSNDKNFVPEVSQSGILFRNPYGSVHFPVYFKCSDGDINNILQIFINLDPYSVRRNLGEKGELTFGNYEAMQDYYFNTVNQETNEYLLPRPINPLNAFNPEYRIDRWKYFMMAIGRWGGGKFYEENKEKTIFMSGYLGTLYQNGQATRRRKDNGTIELVRDLELAQYYFTKKDDDKAN